MKISIQSFDFGTEIGISVGDKAVKFSTPPELLNGSVSHSGVTDLVYMIDQAFKKLAKDE